MRSWSFAFAAVCGLVLVGCFGGGGGVSGTKASDFGGCSVQTSAGSLTYNTVWGTAPLDASQVVQLVDGDGFVLRTDSLNRSGAANSSLVMSNLPAGVHELRVTLYAGVNASSGVIGTTSAVLDLCSGGPGGTNTTLTTRNSLTPDAIEVNFAGKTLKEQQTKQYLATPTAGGVPVFVPQNSLSWSVEGGVGTIDSKGLFTAVTKGSGAVVANLVGSQLVGKASLNVEEKTITTSKWTVMVYMNAANDLFSFSDEDVNEMEQVADNPDVRFVVQWKQSKNAFSGSSFDGVRRYLVKPDTSGQVVSEILQGNLRQQNGQALDMGDPQTLREFVTWAKANYPADRYALIIWNHGNGWRRSVIPDLTRAFSYDDEFGTSIQTWEIGEALQGQGVDILAWDSSLMQMGEVAYEAKDYAQYVAGSEESPPGEGYPYHLVFKPFRDNPTLPTATLSKGFVDGMLGFAPYETRKITQSVLDTSKLNDLAMACDALAGELIANRSVLASVVAGVRNTAKSYSPTTTRVYRDLVDVCERLEADVNTPDTVKAAAANVRAKVAAAVIWEGHNSNSLGSNGISIDFSSSSNFSSVRLDYMRMKWAADTRWDEWLSQAP